MPQFTNQAELPTDSYSMTPSSTNTNQADAGVKQKKMAGITAATLLLGGAAWALRQKTIETQTPESDPVPTGTTPESTAVAPLSGLPDDIDVAGKVTEGMSFEQAFAAAREEVGIGGVFGWHGHWYNTFHKEEWSDLSLDQRQEFTEMVTGEKLPVKIYNPHPPISTGPVLEPTQPVQPEPTIIEGYLNGQRVMGLDYDQDGIIDVVVVDAVDGYTYRVVDAGGDQKLDTLYRYDALDGELVAIEKIEHPFVLSNDDFSQDLEASMSKEVVDSIVDDDMPTSHSSAPVAEPHNDGHTAEPDSPIYLASAHDVDDDTYVNNGDVHDMDE